MENERVLLLHELWVDGETLEAIGKRFGVSSSTIHVWSKRYKLPKRPKPMRHQAIDPTPAEIAERAAACRERHMAARRSEDVGNTHSKTSKWRRGICSPR